MVTRTQNPTVPGLADDRPGEDFELERIVQELGTDDNAFVSVARWSDEKQDWLIIRRYPAASFDLYKIPSLHGGGQYRFRVYQGGKQQKQATMFFEGDPAAVAAPAPNPAAPAPVPAGGGLEARLLELTLQNSARQEAFMQQLILAFVGVIGGKGAGGGSAITGADLIAAIREGRESANASKPATPIEMFQEAVELGMGLAGKSEGENGGGGILAHLPRVLTLVESFAGRAGTGAPPPGVRAPAAAALPAGAGSSAGPAPGAADENPMLSALRQFTPTILHEARGNHDPEAWGEFIAERLNGPAKDSVLALVTLPDEERRTLVLAAQPELGVYMPWVDRAVASIRSFFSDDEGDGASAAHAS